MPQIIMGPSQTGTLDASVKKQAYAFLEKLSENDALPGLHIEPINGSADERVRTGRVNDFHRAVLFKVQGNGDTAHYVYLGVLAHDDAIAFARKARLSVNPVNGIAELIIATQDDSTPAVVPPLPLAAPGAVPDRAPLLPALGLDETALVEDLGLDPDLALAALAAQSEDEIMALAETAVQWQGLALIDLASGTSLIDVKQALGIDPDAAAPTSEGEDAKLLAALQHPAAMMAFAFVEDNDELRLAIEDADFAAWRVFLHPEQRKYATASYNGPFRLSGGAGTGKTVVLLHRARHLAKQNPQARILLTTYTKNLADALKTDFKRLDPTLALAANLGEAGVYICGIDAAVSTVLRAHKSELAGDIEAVLGSRTADISRRTPDSVWQDAAGVATDVPPELRSRTFLTAEYAMVVLPARVTDRDDYLTTRRPGRRVALDRKRRLLVWQIIEAYRTRAGIEGSIDFAEAAAIAAANLQRRAANGAHMVDHVLVDEGQDLNPSHWQFLRALAAEGPNDLFVAEDSYQRIYGQPVVLGRLGIRIVGRSQRLKLNYRTTAQNLHYAVGILDGSDSYVDLEAAPEDNGRYRSARTGPRPRLHECASLTGELDVAAETVQGWLADGVVPETIGILVRDSQQAGLISRGLEERNVAGRQVDTAAIRQGQPLVMTMHRAKGMEFSRVLLFGVNDGLLPAEYLLKGLADADRDDALARERSLLYVAATRARDELVVTSSGDRSPFLPNRMDGAAVNALRA
jgi:superfamily I DNA/RNA helicase